MASALTPAGTLSSSNTTLWGNALLFTNSTVSPLATEILLGWWFERGGETRRGMRDGSATDEGGGFFFFLRKSRGIDRSPRRAGDLTEARRSSSSDVSRDTGRRAGSRVARSKVRGVSGRGTHVEAELAVVAAELDGGGERGGGEEDGGGTDDGGLRGRGPGRGIVRRQCAGSG